MNGPAFRGNVTATALLLDVALLGEDEARRRVCALWSPGTTIRATPDGHWLVILGQPFQVRCERAPGLPLVAVDGGLAQLGLPGRRDTLVVSFHGQVRHWPLAELPVVSRDRWVDLDELPVHRLACLDEPATAALMVDHSVRPEPDLRAAAKLGPPSATARRVAGGAGRGVRGWSVVAAAVAIVAAVLFLVAFFVVDDSFPPIWLLVAVVLFTRAVIKEINRGSAAAGPSSTRTARGSSGWLTRLILRSPARSVIRGRHERYLRKLAQQFRQRRFDEALQDAVSLGSGAGAGSTLRVPRRRSSITPTLILPAGGLSVGYGPEVYRELRDLYRQAANDLEAVGRIEQAAFVYSDLLADPAGAVGLLERHDRLRIAAELAESRELDPDLVVRLWWRAGDRQRAITVARVRGAFAGAIDRLSTVDRMAAVELRREWVRACRQAGDHLAAVEAAWPEETLRHTVLDDIYAGIARGGPTAARLTAYLVTWHPSPDTLGHALDLLAGSDTEHRPERDQFTATLATLSHSDAAQDRQLCTAALRSVVRDGVPDGRAWRRTVQTLGKRADPLAAADLATLALSRRKRAVDQFRFSAPADPGQLPVYDVAALTGGLLVALGDLGVRLLTPEGRVRARWDIATHQLVVADHGGTALLVSMRGTIIEVHRLDLDTRRVRAWTTFHAHRVLPSFDGATLAVVDHDGIAFLDTLADGPRVIWRELASDVAVHAVGRTPERLTVLVTAPSPLPHHPSQVELWSWELPTLTLRLRTPVPDKFSTAHAVVAGEALTAPMRNADGQLEVRRYHRQWRTDLPVPPGTVLRADGNAYLAQTGTDSTVIQLGTGAPSIMHVTFPTESRVGLRNHAGMINLWDRHGRIVCADPDRPTDIICMRTTL